MPFTQHEANVMASEALAVQWIAGMFFKPRMTA